MSGEKNQSSDYFILKPESATFLDLFLFTLSFNFVDFKKLVDCPPGKEELYKSFGDRWIIVHCIILQKILLAIAKKLNFLRRMRAKVLGEPAQKTYASVKCRKWRVEVGKNTKLDDKDFIFKYYGALTIMASNLAYEDPFVVQTVVNNCWSMELGKCYDFWNDFQNKATTQAFTFKTTTTNPNVTVVAFRGSSELGDFLVDLDLSWYNIKGIGHIHNGFMQALGLQKGTTGWPKELPRRPDNHEFAYYAIRQVLREAVQNNKDAQFIITGHSLGGALAVLFVTILAYHGEFDLLQRVAAVFTFGQPRVGNQEFVDFMAGITKTYGAQIYRYVYSFDMVPRVPFDFRSKWYKHCSGCLYYNCCYKGQFLEQEPNPNYFFEILLIPRKYLTALWELIRSLIIPIFKGLSYFEGFSSLIFRLGGLLLPGASAHMCQNYIYSTRYGKIKLPKIPSSCPNSARLFGWDSTGPW